MYEDMGDWFTPDQINYFNKENIVKKYIEKDKDKKDLIEDLIEECGFIYSTDESDGCMDDSRDIEVKFDFVAEWEFKKIYIELLNEDIDSYEREIKIEFANENGVYIELDMSDNEKQLVDKFKNKLREIGVL